MKRNRGVLSNELGARRAFISGIPAAFACSHDRVIDDRNAKKLEGAAFDRLRTYLIPGTSHDLGLDARD